jgi:hypothetical protein
VIRCLHCHAETSNGLALCELCTRAVLTYLEFAGIYFRNLARWRPGRAGARPVPGSREPQGEASGVAADRISRALDEAGAEMVAHALQLADDRPHIVIPDPDDEATQFLALVDLLTEHITSMSTLDWIGEFVTSMRHMEARLRRLTEEYVPGWYAGGCRNCGSGTYVVPGLTWVTCRACGTTTYARDHLDVVLDESRGWVAGPMRLAEALVALLDTEMSVPRLHKRISKWGERGQLDTIRRLDEDGDEVGPKRYRLGDVLDLLKREGQTRTSDEIPESA